MIGFKKQTSNKILGIITSLSVLFGLIFLILKYTITLNDDYKKVAMKDTLDIIGKIEDIRTYKKKAFDIVYNIEGKQYYVYPSITTFVYKKYKKGDTISLSVSKKYPQMAVVKYQ